MVAGMSATLQRHALGITWIERSGTVRSAHAVVSDGRYWLIDPFEDGAALSAAAQLGEPAGVLQLLDRHNRDCESLARRLGVTLLRLPDRTPNAPFEVIPMISRMGWREIGLWWSAQSTLIVAEAVGTAPAFSLGRRAGVHPLLRLTPPRRPLSIYAPERLLVGHGEALESGASAALKDALDHARSDIPRLLVKLPSLLRHS
jgi:hypothetical protein